MKKLLKKIGQNKFQFFFFVGILSFVFDIFNSVAGRFVDTCI